MKSEYCYCLHCLNKINKKRINQHLLNCPSNFQRNNHNIPPNSSNFNGNLLGNKRRKSPFSNSFQKDNNANSMLSKNDSTQGKCSTINLCSDSNENNGNIDKNYTSDRNASFERNKKEGYGNSNASSPNSNNLLNKINNTNNNDSPVSSDRKNFINTRNLNDNRTDNNKRNNIEEIKTEDDRKRNIHHNAHNANTNFNIPTIPTIINNANFINNNINGIFNNMFNFDNFFIELRTNFLNFSFDFNLIMMRRNSNNINVNGINENINSFFNNFDLDFFPPNFPFPRSNGVKKEILKKLTKIVLGDKSEFEQDECVICLENFKKREKLMKSPCSHIFHSKCLIEWLKNKTICPICKYEL